MFGEYPLITFFFRIINALVLFGLGYYLYRRYFKYRIEEKINQKEALFKGLEEQGHALEGRVGFLQRQFQWQEQHINTIKSKIDEWQAAVMAADKKRAYELIQFSQKAAERTQIKNDILAQNYWKQAVMPEALDKAQKELEKEYADQVRNQRYLDEQVKKIVELR